MPMKTGSVGFKCTCRNCFIGYMCVENVLMTMIFDKELVVPGKFNITQIKDRVTGSSHANPFNIEVIRAKEKKQRTKVDKSDGLVWNPVMEGHKASPPRPPHKPQAARRLMQVFCCVTAFPPIGPDSVHVLIGEGHARRTTGPCS